MKWYGTEQSPSKENYTRCPTPCFGLWNNTKLQSADTTSSGMLPSTTQFGSNHAHKGSLNWLLREEFDPLCQDTNASLSDGMLLMKIWITITLKASQGKMHLPFFSSMLIYGIQALWCSWMSTILLRIVKIRHQHRLSICISWERFKVILAKKVKLAIGLESHFGVPNLPCIRASPDTLAAAGLPFRLTEVDVKKAHKQEII